MARFPLTMAEIRFIGTRRGRASSFRLTPNLVEFVPEQFARVDRRQFPPLCHVSSSLIMATESTGRPLVRLGAPSTVRGIVLDIEAKVAVGRSPPRLRIEETALGHGKRIRQKGLFAVWCGCVESDGVALGRVRRPCCGAQPTG